MTDMDFTFDVSDIKFCPGPCNSKIIESKPVIGKNNELWHEFKPHTGGMYNCLTYPIGYYSMNLTNVRLCRDCNSRHLEFWDEQSYENLERDAYTIIEKLNIDLSLYKKINNKSELKEILDSPAFNTLSLTQSILGKEEAKKYNSEDEEYNSEYVEFIRPFDYDHHLEAGTDIKE